jgi:hypothetical protein
MIDGAWLLVVDIVKWILVSGSSYSSIDASTIAV